MNLGNKLYEELADWWPLLSPVEDYKEEAEFFWKLACKYKSDIRTILELGSGGGNNAYYLKKHADMTLSDLSPQMIEVSESINPECKHVVADMRTIELNQRFDMVFIHDAIMFMKTREDLRQLFETAKNHLKKDGILLLMPDDYQDNFKASTDFGGTDGKDRGLRYVEWSVDKDPSDEQMETHYTYILRKGEEIEVIHEECEFGLFHKETWAELLQQAGFKSFFEPVEIEELPFDESYSYEGIVALLK